jgi:GTP-binding protein HflX
MLFATLDTSVRRMTLPGKKEFLLSDTVGFVSKLPTQLIESFKSTLAEAANADLLIQVIDYSDPHYEEMMETTKKTLHQIGIHDIPMIYVFNKADKTENETEYPVLEGDDQLVISAKQDASLDLLVDVIRKHLFQDYVQAKLLIPFADGQVVSYLNEHSNILDTEYQSNGTLLTVEAAPQDYQRFARYEVK